MARPNRSIEKLTRALVSLIHEKPFGEITVSEVTRRAGVSRITFYRNFNTKEDLLRCYVSNVAASVEAIVAKAPGASALPVYFKLLFREISVYSETIRRIYEADLGELIMSAFNNALFRTPRRNDGISFNPYQTRFYTGAFCNVFSAWILSGKKESPEQMAALCCGLIL